MMLMTRERKLWCEISNVCSGSLLIIAVVFIPASHVRADEYRVGVGDVLELSSASIPEFKYRGTVVDDGNVSLPLVGTISARGKSVSDILAIVQTRLPAKVLRRRSADGNEQTVVIDGDEVSLAVAEYSPVYLKGDVSNPGSYPYRPGLTLRQAIALAGGYDTLRIRMENPYLVAVDLRSQRETLANEYARQQARLARVQAELGLSVKETTAAESSRTAADIKKLEVEQLEMHNADFEKERQHLTEAVRSLDENLKILERQMQTEEERAKIDLEDLVRVESLVAKGMAPVTRLSDTRRLSLLSASRATEIEARAEQVKQRRADEQRKLQKLFDERRLSLLKELQDSKIELAAIESKLSAVTEKMFLVGGLRSQIGRGSSGFPELTVYRRNASGTERLVVSEDTELLPRDVIEVGLRFEDAPNHRPLELREHLEALPDRLQTQ
jgi:polysaccharide export outer membrane protein